MKKLLLMRHAKSDWSALFGHDHERPLNERGERAASAMGRWISRTEGPPDLVICSTAERARRTAERAASAGAWRCPLRLEERLYGAAPETILALARDAGDEAERLLLLGHEPGMSGSLLRLVGASVRFPTACVARVDLDIDSWTQLAAGAGQLVWLLPPRLLDGADTG